MEALKGKLGFKGERGYSAYEVAVNNGYSGTEQDWLATLGTSSHFAISSDIYTATDNQTAFPLPQNYNANSCYVEVYVNGLKQSGVTINDENIVLQNSINADDKVEIVMLNCSTNDLPIVTTIDENPTNETAPSTMAVYEKILDLLDKIKTNSDNIDVINSTIDNKMIYFTEEEDIEMEGE